MKKYLYAIFCLVVFGSISGATLGCNSKSVSSGGATLVPLPSSSSAPSAPSTPTPTGPAAGDLSGPGALDWGSVQTDSSISITFSSAVTLDQANTVTLYCDVTAADAYADAVAGSGGYQVNLLNTPPTLSNDNKTVTWIFTNGWSNGDFSEVQCYEGSSPYAGCYLYVSPIDGAAEAETNAELTLPATWGC